jgi:ribosomal protein S18 acetylase RimI-like enzyme
LNLIYKIKTATGKEILSHLLLCKNNFIPPLDKKVMLEEYSIKIAEKAITFEAWNELNLIGLIAAYFNDKINSIGFITNVSLIENFKGMGIASELMIMCINYARQNNFKEIKLEVNSNNLNAIKLYKKFNFQEIENNCNNNILMTFKI